MTAVPGTHKDRRAALRCKVVDREDAVVSLACSVNVTDCRLQKSCGFDKIDDKSIFEIFCNSHFTY